MLASIKRKQIPVGEEFAGKKLIGDSSDTPQPDIEYTNFDSVDPVPLQNAFSDIARKQEALYTARNAANLADSKFRGLAVKPAQNEIAQSVGFDSGLGSTSISGAGRLALNISDLYGKARSALTGEDSIVRAEKSAILKNKEAVDRLKTSSAARRGQLEPVKPVDPYRIGAPIAIANIDIPTTVSTEDVVSDVKNVLGTVFEQAVQPRPGEDPQLAIQRANALVEDSTKVLLSGTESEKRLLIASLQDMGLLPENPIKGEIDSHIPIPKDRQQYIENLRQDVKNGGMTMTFFAKQLRAMANKHDGRILSNRMARPKNLLGLYGD